MQKSLLKKIKNNGNGYSLKSSHFLVSTLIKLLKYSENIAKLTKKNQSILLLSQNGRRLEMNIVLKNTLWLLASFLFLFWIVDITILRNINDENNDALSISSRTAISQSVNRGYLRVKERLTINPTIAEESFIRNYSSNIGFNETDTKRKISIHKITSDPAMIAVEGVTSTSSYFKNYLKDEFPKHKNNITKDKNIVIYEAKRTTTPPKGGVE